MIAINFKMKRVNFLLKTFIESTLFRNVIVPSIISWNSVTVQWIGDVTDDSVHVKFHT